MPPEGRVLYEKKPPPMAILEQMEVEISFQYQGIFPKAQDIQAHRD
jgi:hypothetical protein